MIALSANMSARDTHSMPSLWSEPGFEAMSEWPTSCFATKEIAALAAARNAKGKRLHRAELVVALQVPQEELVILGHGFVGVHASAGSRRIEREDSNVGAHVYDRPVGADGPVLPPQEDNADGRRVDRLPCLQLDAVPQGVDATGVVSAHVIHNESRPVAELQPRRPEVADIPQGGRAQHPGLGLGDIHAPV